MIINLNLEQRALIALLIKDEVAALEYRRRQTNSEELVDFLDEKIDAYETILNKL